MNFGCGCKNGNRKIKREGGVCGNDELHDEGEECQRGGTDLKYEFTEASDVNLRDVKRIMMCLLE